MEIFSTVCDTVIPSTFGQVHRMQSHQWLFSSCAPPPCSYKLFNLLTRKLEIWGTLFSSDHAKTRATQTCLFVSLWSTWWRCLFFDRFVPDSRTPKVLTCYHPTLLASLTVHTSDISDSWRCFPIAQIYDTAGRGLRR